MAFISLFDVIGPNMVGPSSSHTAGAASMALLARRLFPGRIKKVRFTLYGSFARHTGGTVQTGRFWEVSWDFRQMICGSGIP